jgi:hypothetical protein
LAAASPKTLFALASFEKALKPDEATALLRGPVQRSTNVVITGWSTQLNSIKPFRGQPSLYFSVRDARLQIFLEMGQPIYQKISFFNSKALQNMPKLGFLTSGNPALLLCPEQSGSESPWNRPPQAGKKPLGNLKLRRSTLVHESVSSPSKAKH